MSSARNTPPVSQTTGDTQYNVRDAALHGASSAFSKPPLKPKPQANTYTGGNNGALLAATKVGTGGTPQNRTPNTSPLRRDWTGGSARSANRVNPSPMHRLSNSNSSNSLSVPDGYLSDRAPSPSNIAAKLAAARFSPMKPLPQASAVSTPRERDMDERDALPPAGSVGNVLARLDSRKPSRPRPGRRNSIGSNASSIRVPVKDTKATDETPIPPTTSLVSMFEQNRPTTPTKRPTESITASQRAAPSVRSPKPQRKFAIPPEPKDPEALERRTTQSPPPVKPKPQLDYTLTTDGPRDQPISMLRRNSLGTPPVRQKPAQLAAIKTDNPRPRPPSQRASRQARPKSQDLAHSTSFHRRVSTSIDSNENPSSPSSYVSAPEEQEEEEKPRPSLPPPRRSARAKSEAPQSNTRPKTSPLPPRQQTPSTFTSPIHPPEIFPPRSASTMGSSPATTVYHSNYQRESVKTIAKHLTGESLSNAIVGAALASSRNASPAPSSTATPPLPIRRHQHHSPFNHNSSPSPPKFAGKLRTTMRPEPSSSEDEDEIERYKKKGTRIMGMRRKHPNKHHEGTRNRWRDAITERERKRYEGVWAANKGLYIPQATPPPSRNREDSDSTLDVLNLITKEIWTRSRLAEHELEEIWSLVDGRGVGRLKREEFVVGMWLIDQRLKGRKLPVRVSESVWESVRGVGVKIKVGAHK